MVLYEKWILGYFHIWFCVEKIIVLVVVLICPHKQLFVEIICENSYLFWWKIRFFRFFYPDCIDFMVNFILNIVNFPIFQKNLLEYPKFSVYSAWKRCNCDFYCENPKYSGSSCRFLVKLAFWIANIPIFRTFLHQL